MQDCLFQVASEDSPLESIKVLSEVVRSEDAEMLSLDLLLVTEKYPDITEDHLGRLLSLRGDITRQDIREKLADVMKTRNENQNRKKRLSSPPSIFSQINVS